MSIISTTVNQKLFTKHPFYQLSVAKLLLVALCLTVCSDKLWAQTFSAPVEMVDPYPGTGGSAGQYSSLLVVNGNPAIAFYDETRKNLIYSSSADINGAVFNKPVTLDSLGDVGQYLSMQIINGNPAVAYFDADNQSVRFVRALNSAGTSWGNPITVNIPGDGGAYTSLANVSGNPAISYNGSDGNLYYVRATDASGSAWGVPQLLDAGSFGSLKVVNGKPAIAYYDNANGNLKYIGATDATGSAWETPLTIDATSTQVGFFPSLQVVNGNPAIAYLDLSTTDLKYIRATNTDGTAWDAGITIDAANATGLNPSLAIVNGKPAVSYYYSTGGDLRFIISTDINGTAWPAATNAETAGDVGPNSSLTVVNGNPAISYFDQTNLNLRYIRGANITGTTWGAPVTFDAFGEIGRYTSLQLVAGNPAASYWDGTLKRLRFVRASNSSGTLWNAPVSLDNSLNAGLYTSLKVVNGNPAIAYYDQANGNLKYIRSSTSTGVTWATAPINIDVTGDVGLFTSMQIVNGNPAIAYYDQTNLRLKYVRANDASGTSWGTPVIVDAGGVNQDVGQYASLQVINGNPAIAYYDQVNGYLKYIRAADVSGAGWSNNSVLLDENSFAGEYPSLQLVNGVPAVSYHDGSNSALKFIRAADATGTNWNAPVILDANDDAGLYSSLQIINGNPAISYYANITGDLRYIRSNDVSGLAWGTVQTLDAPGITGQFSSMIPLGAAAAIAYYNQDQALPYFIYSITIVPVRFASLQATEQGNDIAIQWKVSTELDLVDYRLETSVDGIIFDELTRKLPLANNGGAANYTYLHLQPGTGDHFYRVKAVSNNGLIEYSAVIRVKIGKQLPPISVFPNPVQSGLINISMLAQPAGIYTARIINANGQLVANRQINHAAGTSLEKIQLLKPPARGNYILQFTSPDGTTFSIVLQF